MILLEARNLGVKRGGAVILSAECGLWRFGMKMEVKDSKPILEIKNLEVKRGGATLLNVQSLIIKEGEILSLIGPNGAGKTTLLQTLSYLLKPFQGEIFFKGGKVSSTNPFSNIGENWPWFFKSLFFSIPPSLRMSPQV
jgi:ABC-type glutathione transport system ATPase component